MEIGKKLRADPDTIKSFIMDRVALQRFGRPEEVAKGC